MDPNNYLGTPNLSFNTIYFHQFFPVIKVTFEPA